MHIPGKIDEEMVVAGMSAADPWIRHAARNVLERNIEFAGKLLHRETNIDAKLQVLLAICRSLRHRESGFDCSDVLASLNSLSLSTASRSNKLAALQCHSLFLGSRWEAAYRESRAAQTVAALYPDQSFVVNRLLSQLLVSLNDDTVVKTTVAALQTTSDPIERFHYLYVLRNAKIGWTDELREVYFTQIASADQFVGGAGMSSFLANIRKESIESLGSDARKQWNDFLERLSRPIKTSPPSKTRSFVRDWTVDELMKSLARIRLFQSKTVFSVAGKSFRKRRV